MSMLNRFRKPGGFQQLLTLIETCDLQKKQNLLQLIGSEDPGWAYLVKLKSIDFDRILSWPQDVLMEITPHLPDKILVTALHIAQISDKKTHQSSADKWLSSLPALKSKEIISLAEMTPINPIEHHSAKIKIIQTVRELESKGILRFSQFDPQLEVDQRIAA